MEERKPRRLDADALWEYALKSLGARAHSRLAEVSVGDAPTQALQTRVSDVLCVDAALFAHQ